ncbi:hypothetical protein Tco_0390540 [Tanacetum coccineum]
MASLDHRLNPLFAIKECSSCGALYTADFCCSKGGFVDKILVPKPPQNCATCGDPVDGIYCRPCAFVRKCLNEGWYTIHDENEILNTSESSNHNTNVKEEERRIVEDQAAKDQYWKIPICYNDDDDEYSFATQEYLKKFSSSDGISEGECDLPVYDDSSLKKDKVLDDIISIPPGNGNDHFNVESSLIESMLNHDNVISFPKIDFLIEEFTGELALTLQIYREFLEVVEIVIPEVGGITDDILLTIKDDILREKLLNSFLHISNLLEETNTIDNFFTRSETFRFNLKRLVVAVHYSSEYYLPRLRIFYDDHIEEKSSGSTTTHSDFSLSKYDLFIFDLSINPFPPADRSDFYHEEFADELAHIISPSKYDCFYFKNEPKLGNLTMDVVEDIFPTREPRVHVANVLPTYPNLHMDLDFILFSDSLFAYIVWIFLAFLTYPVTPPYLLFCGNEDTIFDPVIST